MLKKQAARVRRHASLRKRLAGDGGTPRLAVFRSNRHIYAQVIDDVAGATLASASSLEASVGKDAKSSVAGSVGKLVAERAKAKGISKVVFDRGGFKYHGRVAKVADGAREAGLEL
jgi:large subunit ribosomal protein L18